MQKPLNIFCEYDLLYNESIPKLLNLYFIIEYKW